MLIPARAGPTEAFRPVSARRRLPPFLCSRSRRWRVDAAAFAVLPAFLDAGQSAPSRHLQLEPGVPWHASKLNPETVLIRAYDASVPALTGKARPHAPWFCQTDRSHHQFSASARPLPEVLDGAGARPSSPERPARMRDRGNLAAAMRRSPSASALRRAQPLRRSPASGLNSRATLDLADQGFARGCGSARRVPVPGPQRGWPATSAHLARAETQFATNHSATSASPPVRMALPRRRPRGTRNAVSRSRHR